MAVTVMRLVSKFRFITTEEQLTEFLKAVEDYPDVHKGTVNFVDGHLISSVALKNRILTAMASLRTEANFVVVTNTNTSLDRRLSIMSRGDTRMETTVIQQEVLR